MDSGHRIWGRRLDWSGSGQEQVAHSRKHGRGRLKCDGTRAETGFSLSVKRASPFKSAGTSVQSTTCSRGVRISGSNAGYTMFRGSVKGTGYPLHSPVSPSLPLPSSPCAITFQLESTEAWGYMNKLSFLTRWETISFSKRTMLLVVSKGSDSVTRSPCSALKHYDASTQLPSTVMHLTHLDMSLKIQ